MTAHPGELNHGLQEIAALRQRLAEVEEVASLQADYIALLERCRDDTTEGAIFPWEIIERVETQHPEGLLIDLGVETLAGMRFRVQHFVRGPDIVGQRGVTMTSPWP